MTISSELNMVTVIGFAVSTMVIVFICTRLICTRIHLHASTRSLPEGARSNPTMMGRSIYGLERATVAKFPTKKYTDNFFADAENTQCAICLSEYQGEDVLCILPNCGHSFHVTCIDLWLRQNSSCPVCRISLRHFPNNNQLMQPVSGSALPPDHFPPQGAVAVVATDNITSSSHRNLHNDEGKKKHVDTTSNS
ncbi:putative chromatin regulator PHD family [Lupinus albus]|uniref:Putative chromatin regulator PHD family n=1 Tax=Lupinus albus TaxID=3870 RepID=A0A6A4QD22_LUPAL|nr:putative chromatin regulator PHD family [Lupinus albus]